MDWSDQGKVGLANRRESVAKAIALALSCNPSLIVRQPNPLFRYNLALMDIVAFLMDFASQHHLFEENFYWTSISIEQFVQLLNIMKPLT